MSFDLVPGEHHQLPGSPLTLVVCQVRYVATPAASDPATILTIHERLGGRDGRYPVLEQVQVTPPALPQAPGVPVAMPQVSVGWRFKSDDGTWIVSVLPDAFALETTTGYTSWTKDFRARLVQITDAVFEHVSPAMVQRIGLRYIDQITRPKIGKPVDWAPYIVPELLGPVLHPGFGEAITGAQQQLELDIGDGVRCGLRHGFLRDAQSGDQLTYVLDTDVFRDGTRRYDNGQILADADRFHDVALALFRASITPDLMKVFEEA